VIAGDEAVPGIIKVLNPDYDRQMEEYERQGNKPPNKFGRLKAQKWAGTKFENYASRIPDSLSVGVLRPAPTPLP